MNWLDLEEKYNQALSAGRGITISLSDYRTIADLQSQLDKAQKQVREIGDLCDNCNGLRAAQEIAWGGKRETKDGCNKCWVDKLQAQLDKATQWSGEVQCQLSEEISKGQVLEAQLEQSGARHDACCHDLLGNIDRLEKEKSSLLDTYRWIPVEEGLPEAYKDVETCCHDSILRQLTINEEGEWITDGVYRFIVTHWREIDFPETK